MALDDGGSAIAHDAAPLPSVASSELNPTPPTARDATAGGGAIAGLEILVAVVAVACSVIYWLFWRRGRAVTRAYSPPHVSEAAAISGGVTKDLSDVLPNQRYHAFVESEVAANSPVLFVETEERAATFHSLFNALEVDLHVVNLARTAGGRHILDALHEKYPTPTGEKLREFLFVNGTLLGGQRDVRKLLVAGALSSLGSDCNWEQVRVDRKSETGFMVLGAQNGFQCVGDVAEDANVAAKMEARPLRTVEEVGHFDTTTLIRSPVPIAARSRAQARRSKLLVCHDMKGGYQEDRFKQVRCLTACLLESTAHAIGDRTFYQWDLVDLFVYFGHALVCPPPVGWVTAGHRHGTRVLGTFLTEGEHGSELCKELFKDVHSAENDIPAELVPNVDAFLHTLRNRMKVKNPLAQVVWYGSLSRSGRREAHVRLDEYSAEFFRNVDAFYGDYGWVADDAKFSAAFDLDRRYDVYMGIDVFGRHNTPGGGKMNCAQPLRWAWNSGVSAALFAPGWTHECYQHEEQEDFVVAEVLQSLFSRCAMRSTHAVFLLLVESLLGGYGQRVSTTSWSNMAELDVQPMQKLHVGDLVTTATGSMQAVISHDTAFQGGASVMIQGQLVGREKAYFKLFDVDIEFSPRRVMEISYATATREDSVCLLVLTVCPGLDRATHHMILRSADDSDSSSPASRKKTLSSVAKASLEKHFYLPVATESFGFEGTTSDAGHGVTTDGWCKKTYRLGGQLWDQKHIVEMGVLCTKKTRQTPGEREDYLAYIGEVCVVGSSGKTGLKTALRDVHSQPKWCENARLTSFERHDAQSVSFGVQWGFAQDGAPVRCVLVFARGEDGARIFLGKSFDDSFWVSNCPWKQEEATSSSSSTPTRLTIQLQSVSWAGQSSTSPSGICQLHLDSRLEG
ncbi:hypothetical protein BBJ28_00022416 [Nothophytophthora sp. Chile5]|nr:hypothetical protein BBJ28_00022416 [Nothophytophthora sp. Chile5]